MENLVVAVRDSPENFFRSRLTVQTQEPMPVTASEPLPVTSLQTMLGSIDPNVALVLGLVAIVGIIGLLAFLSSEKRCR